jgi:hypothetical protein
MRARPDQHQAVGQAQAPRHPNPGLRENKAGRDFQDAKREDRRGGPDGELSEPRQIIGGVVWRGPGQPGRRSSPARAGRTNHA